MSEWWKRTEPHELKAIPWLHPAVVLYLEQLLQPDWRVLEHGSGGSTLWLAERCAQVVAIESDEKYFDALQVPDNVDLILHRGGVFEHIDKFDLLLIDGEVSERGAYLNAAHKLVKAGGIVVLDNANRSEYAHERTELKRRAAHSITFEVNPPGHTYCVTDFYRLKGGIDWI